MAPVATTPSSQPADNLTTIGLSITSHRDRDEIDAKSYESISGVVAAAGPVILPKKKKKVKTLK